MQGIDECLLEAMRLPGARGAALVDWTSGLALGAVGESPGGDPEAAAAEAAELARLAAEQRAFTAETSGASGATGAPGAVGAFGNPDGSAAGLAADGTDGTNGTVHHGPAAGAAGNRTEPPVEDLILSNRDSYHVLRFVPTSFDSSVFLHLWLTRAEGNLALARIRLGEMAGRLELG